MRGWQIGMKRGQLHNVLCWAIGRSSSSTPVRFCIVRLSTEGQNDMHIVGQWIKQERFHSDLRAAHPALELSNFEGLLSRIWSGFLFSPHISPFVPCAHYNVICYAKAHWVCETWGNWRTDRNSLPTQQHRCDCTLTPCILLRQSINLLLIEALLQFLYSAACKHFSSLNSINTFESLPRWPKKSLPIVK